MIHNFIEMPVLLKLLTIGGIVILFFVIGSMIPYSSTDVFGQPVTTVQWWSSGAGPFSLVVGLLISMAIVMMLLRSRYGRPAYILSWTVLSLSVPFTANALGSSSSHILAISISNVMFTLVMSFYLYASATVSHFFAMRTSRTN